VVVEADFPDAFRLNLWVRGLSQDGSPEAALADFVRFPTWMWRNTVVVEFAEWLRQFNSSLPPERRQHSSCGFYGMDVYSLHSSAAKVVEYLERADPEAARRAKSRYACFDSFGADTMAYAYAVGVGGATSCADAAVSILKEVVRNASEYGEALDGEKGQELAFAAQCNAAVVSGAEQYYRNMFFGDELTWNIRDSHFLDTVQAIRQHLSRRRPADDPPRLVLWAHNSHLGDARATDMGQRRGEHNIGQLCREAFGLKKVYNIGFTTHTGTVSAADDWDTPVQCKQVRKSMPGSYEHLFHKAGMPEFALDLRGGSQDLQAALQGPLLERAIGVIYRPRTERQSHYFYCELPQQFDAIIHIDSTAALHPLEKTGRWETDWRAREDMPEWW
jgi:erythromycin esterase-like protein